MQAHIHGNGHQQQLNQEGRGKQECCIQNYLESFSHLYTAAASDVLNLCQCGVLFIHADELMHFTSHFYEVQKN